MWKLSSVVMKPVLTGAPPGFRKKVLKKCAENWIRAAPVAMLAVDSGGRFIFINEAARDLLNIPTDRNYEFDCVYQYCSEGVAQKLRLCFEALSEKNPSCTLESALLKTSRQHEQWCRVVVSVLSNADAEAVFGLTLSPLSDFGFVTKDEMRAKAWLTKLALEAPFSIICTDAEGKIVLWNKASEKLFGWTKDEVLGKESPALAPPELYADALCLYHTVKRGRPVRDHHTERLCKDGSRVKLSIWCVPVFDEKRTLTQIVSVLLDRTQEARLEESLRLSTETAEAIHREKTQFLASVSHDLRTPLAAILGFSEICMERPKDKHVRREMGSIRRNAEHLLRLVNSLLDVAKVEAGELDIQEEDFNLIPLIEEVIHDHLPQVQEKGIQLRVTCEENLSSRVHSDPARIRQILVNLIGNAVKFTESGSIKAHVSSLFAGDHESIAVDIEDTGIGIDPDNFSRLFKPFSQASPEVGRQFGGSGIGLAFSHKIARRLGGDLFLLNSKPQGGSTFRLVLDPKRNHIQEQRPSEEGDKNGASAILSGRRVLLVDDYPDNREIVRYFLEQAGATVEEASNGRDALDRVEHFPYDVILMDLQMPEMDGYEATRTLRELGCTIPIIALTAHAMEHEKERCLAGGFSSYLTKPINPSELVHTVEQRAS